MVDSLEQFHIVKPLSNRSCEVCSHLMNHGVLQLGKGKDLHISRVFGGLRLADQQDHSG